MNGENYFSRYLAALKQKLIYLMGQFSVNKPLSQKPAQTLVSEPMWRQLITLPSYVPRGLLIFIDDIENDEFRILARSFVAAFAQQAGPLVVSASLLMHIQSSNMPKNKNPSQLADMLKKIRSKNFLNRTVNDVTTYKSIVAMAVGGGKNAEHWIIKEINPLLYLLVPKKYLKELGISLEEVTAYERSDALTPTERILGLKVNHLKNTTLGKIKKPVKCASNAYYVVPSLAKLFVTNKEYAHYQAHTLPAWSMYIMGHGGIKSHIAYLSIEDFKQFLAFLKNLHMRLLIYSSCYTGGINEQLIYKDVNGAVTQEYPFALISNALTDNWVYSSDWEIIVNDNKLVFESHDRYDLLFKAITTPEHIDYYRAIKQWDSQQLNKAKIKFPGLTWFSVVDRERVVEIGSILAQARKTPLHIDTFFGSRKNDIEAILLYAPHIPFELIITLKNKRHTAYVPKFISMIPGVSKHYIKKITAPNVSLKEVLDAFLENHVGPFKLFVIDEIEALTPPDLSSESKIAVFKDVSLIGFSSSGYTGYYNAVFMYNQMPYGYSTCFNVFKGNLFEDKNLENLYYTALQELRQHSATEKPCIDAFYNIENVQKQKLQKKARIYKART